MYRFYMALISRKIYVLDSLRKAQSLNEKKNQLTFTAICLFWLDQFFLVCFWINSGSYRAIQLKLNAATGLEASVQGKHRCALDMISDWSSVHRQFLPLNYFLLWKHSLPQGLYSYWSGFLKAAKDIGVQAQQPQGSPEKEATQCNLCASFCKIAAAKAKQSTATHHFRCNTDCLVTKT